MHAKLYFQSFVFLTEEAHTQQNIHNRKT